MIEEIKKLSEEIASELVDIRSHLHSNPELSFKEYKTCQYVKEQLENLGLKPKVVAKTGLVANIECKNPKKRIVGLRADMDALPIQEENEVSYKSKNPGVMHACGHDVHTTCLLGAARVLLQLKDKLEGTIKLVFQPGEEVLPGGASLMLKDGVFKTLKPEVMYALHVMPQLNVGTFGLTSGPCMASVDDIDIIVKGSGGHAAAPHLAEDTVLAASEIVVGLQKIISRVKNPLEPSVLSFCVIEGGHANNIIPETVTIKGTLRCFSEEWRKIAQEKIKNFVSGYSSANAIECSCDILSGYPVVNNDPLATNNALETLQQMFGLENVSKIAPSLGAEDFAYFASAVPSCFFRLGVRNEEKGITYPLHTSRFDVDDHALTSGTAAMALLAVGFLKGR